MTPYHLDPYPYHDLRPTTLRHKVKVISLSRIKPLIRGFKHDYINNIIYRYIMSHYSDIIRQIKQRYNKQFLQV